MKLPSWLSSMLSRLRGRGSAPEPADTSALTIDGRTFEVRSFTFQVDPPPPEVTIRFDDGYDGADEPDKAPTPPPAPPRMVGRQNIDVVQRSPMGRKPWRPEVPAHAQCAPWSQVHRYPKGVERQTDYRAPMVNHAPPLALICVGCELEQPPLMDDRKCPYCGINLFLHGPVVFWWRDPVDVPEWKP